MSAVATVFAVSCSREQSKRATTLQRERQLNQFFAEVERFSDNAPTASHFAGDELDTATGETGVRWTAPLGTEFTIRLPVPLDACEMDAPPVPAA